MSKVLFINMLGYGHINPTLGLVEELIKRGEKITYLAEEEFREKIEKTGVKFKGYKIALSTDSLADIRNSEERIRTLLDLRMQSFKEIVKGVFEEKEEFDYVIYDSAFMLGEEIGKVLNIPTVCSITTFATNNNIKINKIASYSDKLETLMNNPNYMSIVKELKDGYSIRFPDISNMFKAKGMINIVYTSRYFQPNAEEFDESYKFIGPSIIDRKENINFSFKKFENKKVIYIALGTIFNNCIEFYENCFKAFEDMDVQVIMSIGNKLDINNAFKYIPQNFTVRNYIPQLEVLKYADVFITHGGMNSTNEGLYYNVPLILIPQSVDQPFVASRVEKLGSGIIIEKDKVTSELLKESVINMFENKNFRLNSEKNGQSLRDAGGYKKGVDEIFKL
ncbi:macrolide family glycosyltransferase [Clostridium saccharobutylicum]|uniref:Oleandomycin glycosyltransferase n=1 Tax=Clostridium saccharobutylicum TaxID=169679 RepID=A0A1S8MTK3_CLOSA|nr:macrolide family glycosyltransferase [Clostridium saccharobutylicum]OOM07507.1 oleandomycin glycosyltransferase [Clostridium saccharobutylicum]